MVNPANSDQVMTANSRSTTYRVGPGDWRETSVLDVAPEATDAVGVDASDLAVSAGVIALLALLSWLVVPWPTMKWVLLGLNLLTGVIVTANGLLFTTEELWEVAAAWAVVGVVAIGLVRLAWWNERRHDADEVQA
jgi:hypothetical protein